RSRKVVNEAFRVLDGPADRPLSIGCSTHADVARGQCCQTSREGCAVVWDVGARIDQLLPDIDCLRETHPCLLPADCFANAERVIQRSQIVLEPEDIWVTVDEPFPDNARTLEDSADLLEVRECPALKRSAKPPLPARESRMPRDVVVDFEQLFDDGDSLLEPRQPILPGTRLV